MGREKLLLDAGAGEPLVLARQRQLLELGLPTFLLAAPGRATPRQPGVVRLHDPEPSGGPLAALCSAHARLGGELLVLAADQPRVGEVALRAILQRAGEATGAAAVVAREGNPPQPFPGLYRPAFFAGLAPGQRSIVDALAAARDVVGAALSGPTLHDWDTPRDRAGREEA